jgi:hypothetical protein
MAPVAAASGAVVDGVDVDAVATAVRGCPWVHGLHGGHPRMTATYLPGRRVDGVRVDRQAVVVQVRARWGATRAELAAEIRTALRPLVGGRRIDIVWAELADPPPPPPPTLATDPGAMPEVGSGASWTRTDAVGGRAGAISSVPTTQTAAATQPPSSPA